MDDLGYCGGTIISDDFVMTAAHCVADYSQWVIMAGAHDITAEMEPSRIEITSYDAFPHPEWNPTKWYGDVGLIRLPEPLNFDNNPAIRPACLPPSVKYLKYQKSDPRLPNTGPRTLTTLMSPDEPRPLDGEELRMTRVESLPSSTTSRTSPSLTTLPVRPGTTLSSTLASCVLTGVMQDTITRVMTRVFVIYV